MKIVCFKFAPVLETNNPFNNEDDLQVWFSNDGNYIAIKILMKSKIGLVKAHLISYSN